MTGAVVTPGPVSIRVLGGFEVFVGERSVPSSAWQSRKARELLWMLLARRGRPVPREVLAEQLWPGGDPARMGHRLSVQLSLVRAALGRDRAVGVFRTDRGSVALDLTLIQVDVEDFLATAVRAIAACDRGRPEEAWQLLVRAEHVYRGDPFEDEPYLEGVWALREEARATYLAVVRQLAQISRSAGRIDQAVRYLLRILARDPYDEPAHRAIVETLVGGGRHGEARRAFARYVAALGEIGVPPPGHSLLQPIASL